MKKISKKITGTLKAKKHFVIPVIISVVGATIIISSFAAISSATIEPENGAIQGSAQSITDSGSSGGRYVRFGSGATGGTNPPTGGTKCNVSLHGGTGGIIGVRDWGRYNNLPVAMVEPRADPVGKWLYDGPDNFQYDPGSAVDETYYNNIVTRIENFVNAAGCNGAILLMGGSNGGALAAKMYCKGYNFNGRLAGLILDDPVPDQAVLNCNRQNLKSKVYLYSDGLVNEANQAGGVGYRCSRMPSQWYCENDTAITRTQFEQAIGFSGIRQRQYHSCTSASDPACGYVNTNEDWGDQIVRFWQNYDSL